MNFIDGDASPPSFRFALYYLLRTLYQREPVCESDRRLRLKLSYTSDVTRSVAARRRGKVLARTVSFNELELAITIFHNTHGVL